MFAKMFARISSIVPISIITSIILMIGCSEIPAKSNQNAQPESVATSKSESSQSPQPQSVATSTKSESKSQKRTGNFISGEHTTTGVASIVQENGTYFIELDQTFKTSSSGPDLFVILHRSPDILKITKPPAFGIAEGDFVTIAPLKSFDGKQRYEVPKNIQPDSFKSVLVWCRQYNATFGFAPLSKI
jgi:hypothetical protein